jgi:hypothetical protein
LDAALTAYATGTALTEGLAGKQDKGDYVTAAVLDTVLTGYITTSALDTTLTSYMTTSMFGTALTSYAKTVELTDGLAGKQDKGDYVLTSTLDTTLTAYASAAALTEGLAGKQDKGEYYTKSEVEAIVKPYTDRLADLTANMELQAGYGTTIASTVKLLKDVTVSGTSKVTGTAYLNLNGHTLQTSSSETGGIDVHGTSAYLTIDGPGVISCGSATAGQGSAVYTLTGGHIIINAGTFINNGVQDKGCSDIMVRGAGATCTINGGYFINQAFSGKTADEVKALDVSHSDYILNAQDQDDSHYILNGGSFFNWSPEWHSDRTANTAYAANGKEIVVSDGYVITEEADKEYVTGYKGTWYTVTKQA